ncbi:MAG: DUF1857 family protein [Gammaproteobacteria bacterium]|nr:DUF1857 family protein [Gammaproteobacteria bacterium]
MFFKPENNQANSDYENAEAKYLAQIFRRVEDINFVLQKNADANPFDKSSLTKNEAWRGFKWKAETPHKYIPVTETAIIPDSQKLTSYGESFTRLTIQPSFVTGKYVVVKEDIHIFEKANRILFLGVEVDPLEAEQYLLGFKPELLTEKPALFHVEHAITGTEEQPIATWQMIRLCDRPLTDPDEAETVKKIRDLISGNTGIRIYMQTIKQLEDEQAPRNDMN